MATKAFNLPQIAPDQAQKHIPVNWSLDLIDAALAGVVISATRKTPPASPVQGDAYLVPSGGKFGDVTAPLVAVWNADAWHGFNLPQGSRIAVADEGGERVRTGLGWMPGQVRGPKTGAGLGVEVRDAILNLRGASVKATGLIPPRAIVLGVTSWTIAAIKGAPSYGVGLPGEATKFGGHLGVAAKSSNIGVVGPFATYSPTDVVVTATSGSFTAGKIGLAVSLIMPSPAPV